MKRRRLGACLAVLLAATGATSSAAELRLTAHERHAMRQPGATAAFALDAGIVEVALVDGRLMLVALRPGRTLVSVVRPERVETLEVTVQPAPSRLPRVLVAKPRDSGSVSLRHDSGIDRTGLGASLRLGDATRGISVDLQAVHGGPATDREGAIALPSARVELRAGDRSVTLLDDYVEASPLTLDGVVVRGVHLRDATRTFRAGVASARPWDDLLLPAHGDRVASAQWSVAHGALEFVPTLLWLPDSDTAVAGVAALGVRRGGRDDALAFAAELGWSDVPGASFDVSLNQDRRHAWLRGAYRPARFAATDVARPPGAHLDGAWTERLSERTQASIDLSASRLDLETRDAQAQSLRTQVRHQFDSGWSIDGGVGAGRYRERGETEQRRGTLALGAGFDRRDLGLHLQYRHQDVEGGKGGHGARLALRAARGGMNARLHLDAQQNASSLELLLPPDSDVARAFSTLGLVAQSPEDAVRLLREHAGAFAQYGVSVGSLRFDRLRLLGGMDVAWQREDALHSRYGLRLLAEQARGYVDTRRTALATLFASWQVPGRSLAIELGLTRWMSDAAGGDIRQNSVQVSLRHDFDRIALPGAGRRAIRGWVLHDAARRGVPAPDAAAVAGVEIVLDDSRRTRTDSDGYFCFDAPGPGEHRIVAELPSSIAGYFTGAATRVARAGEELRFGVLPAPAHVRGRVRSDAGLPLAGVRVRMSGAAESTTTTDSSGTFRFATPPGEVVVSVLPDSVPPGHELGELAPHTLRASIDAPGETEFVLGAQRSVRGTIAGAGASDSIVVETRNGRSVAPDARGNFVLRGLPSGEVTLVVRNARGETRHAIVLPEGPGRIDQVQLRAP